MIGLPILRTVQNAEDLIGEINADAGDSVVSEVRRYVATTDSVQAYTGYTGTNFALVPGEGYQVVVTANVTYSPDRCGDADGDYV